jgi:hypothetical protein
MRKKMKERQHGIGPGPRPRDLIERTHRGQVFIAGNMRSSHRWRHLKDILIQFNKMRAEQRLDLLTRRSATTAVDLHKIIFLTHDAVLLVSPIAPGKKPEHDSKNPRSATSPR